MTEYIDFELLVKILWFVIPGLLGMFYAYTWRWVDTIKDKSLLAYLFGDTRALIKALLVFSASCAGILSLDYLNMLDNLHLGIAGLGLGLLIPQKVDEKSEKSTPIIPFSQTTTTTNNTGTTAVKSPVLSTAAAKAQAEKQGK